jgi:hypothetical protein
MTARRTEVSPIVEAEIVAEIEHWLDLIGEAMTSAAGRMLMQREFLRQLEASDAATLPTAEIIEVARSGNQAADLALRQFAATRMDRWEQLTAQLQDYAIRCLTEPLVSFPPGGATDVIDVWTRDIAIRVVIEVGAMRWQLPKTRSRGTLAPSAAYFASLALRKRGFRLKEGRVNRIYWERGTLAERVAASLFPSSAFQRNLERETTWGGMCE